MASSPLKPGWMNMGGIAAHRSRALGNWQSDNAIDMGVRAGTPVYACISGIVDPNAGFGFRERKPYIWGYRFTLISKSGSRAFFYTHLGAFKNLRPGIDIQEGDVVGWIGKPPWFPSHLHFGAKPPDNPELIAYSRAPTPHPRTREELLQSSKGYWSWVQWKLGEGKWKKYGKQNPSVRPSVPLTIPQAWWGRIQIFLANRR